MGISYNSTFKDKDSQEFAVLVTRLEEKVSILVISYFIGMYYRLHTTAINAPLTNATVLLACLTAYLAFSDVEFSLEFKSNA